MYRGEWIGAVGSSETEGSVGVSDVAGSVDSSETEGSVGVSDVAGSVDSSGVEGSVCNSVGDVGENVASCELEGAVQLVRKNTTSNKIATFAGSLHMVRVLLWQMISTTIINPMK